MISKERMAELLAEIGEPPKTEHRTDFGNWSVAGVPHKGWVCLGIDDLGEPSETCEMCQTAEVRFVHMVWHRDWGEMRVGCVCAGRMTDDVAGAHAREEELKACLRSPRKAAARSLIDGADQVLAHQLTDKERDFVRSIRARAERMWTARSDKHDLTPRQQDWFAAIYKRYVPRDEWPRRELATDELVRLVRQRKMEVKDERKT